MHIKPSMYKPFPKTCICGKETVTKTPIPPGHKNQHPKRENRKSSIPVFPFPHHHHHGLHPPLSAWSRDQRPSFDAGICRWAARDVPDDRYEWYYSPRAKEVVVYFAHDVIVGDCHRGYVDWGVLRVWSRCITVPVPSCPFSRGGRTKFAVMVCSQRKSEKGKNVVTRS